MSDPVRAKLLDAVTYVLTRAQHDPDLGYYLGPHTEAWERLVAAEAAGRGANAAEHRALRARDLSGRQPRVKELEERLEKLKERADAFWIAGDDE